MMDGYYKLELKQDPWTDWLPYLPELESLVEDLKEEEDYLW